eukprot:642971-Prorocentrum_minimum.AAC.1
MSLLTIENGIFEVRDQSGGGQDSGGGPEGVRIYSSGRCMAINPHCFTPSYTQSLYYIKRNA